MAQLQLAPCPHMDIMLPFNKMQASELHSNRQTHYEQGSSTHPSRLEHLKNNFQQKLLRGKEEKLENLFIHNRQNTLTKAQSCSSSYSTESQQDSGNNHQGPGSGDFYPVGGHRHTKTDNQESILPFTKKRAGVDRAYPLKPVFHRKSLSATHIRIESGNFPLKSSESKEISPSHFSSRSRRNLSSAKMLLEPLPVVQPKKFLSNLERTELIQIKKLEAAGESLEEEIRRQEILLKEKLKKTEEELRRIQKEKEQVEEEEKRELQKETFPRKVIASSSNISKLIFSPELESENVFPTYGRYDETWEESQENSSSSSACSQFFNHGVQRLKKEKLVASNNKIQDQISESSPEQFSQLQQESSNSLSKSPTDSSPRLSVSSGSSSATEEPQLGECSYCGRKFLLLRLEKHTNVCSKTQGSKRKVFDSSKARAKGTELEQYLTWKGPTLAKPEPPKKSNWRQKHESFIRTLRQAREVQQVIARGGNPSDLPPMPPAENPDYIQCPHCSRHFAPKVADRHIPKCKTIKNRPPPPRKRCC
ncbi:zinc finger C2HC domain-containing protein 1C [Monodelphis domestica]|uniref:zinc finger C2HC domain-containing protein 1C n=1 Tax=Monodelphis domestica TaxID=13616 RepID=UPI0024E244AA|nr:zinc finger C2HC domain-containing protein 1C [Monodelphis domestica]XP_056666656.1 zinc finger C2HC domain-containing protein 1C [Monodelphis domestica]